MIRFQKFNRLPLCILEPFLNSACQRGVVKQNFTWIGRHSIDEPRVVTKSQSGFQFQRDPRCLRQIALRTAAGTCERFPKDNHFCGAAAEDTAEIADDAAHGL